MIIANPRYYVVFQYLMKDIDIRDYINALTDEKIENINEEFVELLTNNSFIVQVGDLSKETKTKLERVLRIFNSKYKTTDRHKLDFTRKTDDPLIQKMVNRLQCAIVDDEMRRKMYVEDEIEQILERENSISAAEIAAQKIIIAAQNRVISDKEQAIADKEQAIADKEQAIADKEQAIADKNELFVRTLILNTDLPDAQIASLAGVSVSFVQECRANSNKV